MGIRKRTRVVSSMQREARKRNFAIYRLGGAKSLFATLSVQFGFNEAEMCMHLCNHMIRKLKGR